MEGPPCSCLVPAGIAIILPNLGGILGGIPVRKNLPWYQGLNKPTWGPPRRIIAPIWTTLYSGVGYASYVVWKQGGGFNGPARIPLMLYGGHLALNWSWSWLFFGAHKLKLAFVQLLAIDTAAAVTAYSFYQINPKAGYCFLPYLAWLGFATAISFRIWRDNPEGGAIITEIKDK